MLEHRCRDHVAHLAFDLAAIGAVAVDRCCGLGHHARLQLGDGFGQFGDACRDLGIGRDRGIDGARVPARKDEAAGIVEGQFQMPQIAPVGIGLHDGHQRAVIAADPDGIGPRPARIVGREVGMRVPPDHRVDPRHAAGDLDIARDPDVIEREDMTYPRRLERRDLARERRDLVLERDVGTGARGVDRIGRERRDDPDLPPADLEHDMAAHAPRKTVRPRDIDVARHHRKVDPVEEIREAVGAVVEFVIADRHRIEADPRHHLGFDGALVGRVIERPLELVARVEDDDILPRIAQRCARLGDDGGQPRRTAKALAGRVVLGRAGRIELADRFDPAVKIVDVQDMQHEFRLRRPGRKDHCGNSSARDLFHFSLQCVLVERRQHARVAPVGQTIFFLAGGGFIRVTAARAGAGH